MLTKRSCKKPSAWRVLKLWLGSRTPTFPGFWNEKGLNPFHFYHHFSVRLVAYAEAVGFRAVFLQVSVD